MFDIELCVFVLIIIDYLYFRSISVYFCTIFLLIECCSMKYIRIARSSVDT